MSKTDDALLAAIELHSIDQLRGLIDGGLDLRLPAMPPLDHVPNRHLSPPSVTETS